MITISQPEYISSSLIEKIKEVATQKIVLVMSKNNETPETSNLEKLLPNSKVVKIGFDLQQKIFSLSGENPEAKTEIKKIFEDSGFQLKK